MAEAAIAVHVDHDVFFKFLAIFGRDARNMHNGFRIVAVDVEDRRLEHLDYIRAIRARTAEFRHGRKADLVVDDNMNGAADAVARQVGDHQRFRRDTLPRESRIAVQQQRQHSF